MEKKRNNPNTVKKDIYFFHGTTEKTKRTFSAHFLILSEMLKDSTSI